ncbi:hypothetical protein Pla123a_09220 [Posidoniimonas polymericola]|uniref:PEP-CTERM protein-sorting domain-containing protein n=1 Tax=Posidoniimonas polymericola TaxID=2528002 RepID=A0A5C5YT12_9BACT|nr:hypothetical protein [Posidoniimonas polymericola]TWT78132.1 hypothetical protein Pla123a_09220 [Posidoniimonas polymericola]
MKTTSVGFVCACAVLSFVSPARAYLGSFSPSDGYDVQSGLVYGDVSYYDAGQYGANAGGGAGPNQIAADSGLWSVASPVGGYFSTLADRANYTAATPPYPVTGANALAAYVVGNHSPGRTDSSSLAIRNDTPLGVTGPLVYNYDLDAFDFNGVTPSTINGGVVQMGLYFCPNPGDTPQPGTAPREKFTMSLVDGGGNIGLEWGYGRDNSVTWRDGPTSAWNITSFIADQTNWDGVQFDLDLTADTFSMDYYDVSANTWTNLVPAGTAMGQPMGDFTHIRWQLEDGLSAGVGGKNFFDDFSFTTPVPEPAGAVLCVFGGAMVGATRRRTKD